MQLSITTEMLNCSEKKNTESTSTYEEYHRSIQPHDNPSLEYQQLAISRRTPAGDTQLNMSEMSAAYEVVATGKPRP